MLAVDLLPNAFRIVANVTGMLAVTTPAGGKVDAVQHVPGQVARGESWAADGRL